MRWDDTRASQAYTSGVWRRATLADTLAAAARSDPQRILLVDGCHRIDAQTLHARASALAQAMLNRVPTGSVVSFMLPNWHEAAIIYLAATLAGMVVNPILPSLRDIPNAERDYRLVDGHPDARGHAMIAQLIARQMTSGAVPAIAAADKPQPGAGRQN